MRLTGGLNNEKVRVISLSLGIKKDVPKLHEAIKRAISNNVSVIASSGNDGDGNATTAEYRYPGAYPEVIVVGAANNERDIAHFSNTNEFVDIYAPGVGIYSSYKNGEYKVLAGTSMAAAHVSGAIALLIEEYEHILSRKLNEDEVFKLLMKHTTIVDTDMDVLITVLDLDQKVTIEPKEVVYNG
jgi:major intracellular serine protease